LPTQECYSNVKDGQIAGVILSSSSVVIFLRSVSSLQWRAFG